MEENNCLKKHKRSHDINNLEKHCFLSEQTSINDLSKTFTNMVTKSNSDEINNKFDKIIDEIEPGALRIPVLIKKYVKQNARLVAFNVDPKFNNAVDGLMYIKVADIPESTVKPVMEEFQAELERKAADLQKA